MKILLTGKDGQIGWELARALAPLGEVVATGRAELDLTDADAIRRTVRAVAPDAIVNAAAYTAVDKAETEPEIAGAVNAVAPGVIALEAKRLGALLVHYSTDYVFDGRKTSPYTEDDATGPLNVYGLSKLGGEMAASSARHLILRTSWVYAARGRNFLLTMLKLASERDELKIVDDQIGAPTSARAIADATAQILKKGDATGLFHLTAAESTSWLGFARAIFDATEAQRGRSPKLVPITSEAYNAPAKRPKNSVLSNEKLQRVLGITISSWQEQLEATLKSVL